VTRVDKKYKAKELNHDPWIQKAAATGAGMTRSELILRYTLSHPACHTTIVGTCNSQHLAENVSSAKRGPLGADLLDEIARRVRSLSNPPEGKAAI
jgi:aryl-alcohol dehydrogenase-like predicted oxidoreductase